MRRNSTSSVIFSHILQHQTRHSLTEQTRCSGFSCSCPNSQTVGGKPDNSPTRVKYAIGSLKVSMAIGLKLARENTETAMLSWTACLIILIVFKLSSQQSSNPKKTEDVASTFIIFQQQSWQNAHDGFLTDTNITEKVWQVWKAYTITHDYLAVYVGNVMFPLSGNEDTPLDTNTDWMLAKGSTLTQRINILYNLLTSKYDTLWKMPNQWPQRVITSVSCFSSTLNSLDQLTGLIAY